MRMNASTVLRNARGANPGLLLLGILCIGLLAIAPAADAAELEGLTVIGVAPDGTETEVTEYRWLVEEDQTYHVPVHPDGTAMGGVNFDPNWQQGMDGHPGGQTLSVSFHDSYMPVVAKGCVGDAAWQIAAACNDFAFAAEGTKHYFVSVVPRHSGAADPVSGRPAGYSIGGAPYDPAGTIVYVHENPIQTAQISILVFEDNNAINGAPDLPEEDPATPGNTPMDGFTVVLEDGGGRYGASAGVQSQDAFGNPLGTTYDAAGDVNGFEPLITGPDGRLTIKNLAPGKYGVQIVPPPGQEWVQTSTIEGTKIIDTWVKANEPPFFAEFGPPGFHAFLGFVRPFNNLAGGSATLSGKVVNNHMSRPPEYAFYNGSCFGHTTPWVGLNTVTGGIPGEALFAAPTVGECDFTIPNVPDGTYQLVVWDTALDLIIAAKGVTVENGTCDTPNGSCDFTEVPVFQWFHRQEHRVFDDVNANGIWDPSEPPVEVPINDQGFNLRWRDGTVYQGNVSDFTGAYTFDQVFPFFSWLVAEVDFVRFEATGLTSVVDNGGPIPDAVIVPPWEEEFTFGGAIAPQNQTTPTDPWCDANPALCQETETHVTELGPILTAGFQGFIGQTNAFLWGKRHYPDIPGFCEDGATSCTSDADCALILGGTCDAPGIAYNGGISGMVFYAITRAEDDPAGAAAEPWEPGIPGVEVNLWSADGSTLLNSTTTDSWDDSIPTDCKYGDSQVDEFGNPIPFSFTPDGDNFFVQDCYDGLRAFNQIRPAVFDGGYAFGDVCVAAGGFDASAGTCPGDAWQGFITPGPYMVEVVPPPGYEILKPEDKNVDFGDEYEPEATLAAAKSLKADPLPVVPRCVGTPTLVPAYLTLYPDQLIEAPFAGTLQPLCDRKEVVLTSGANAAADFWLFTEVPVAAHANGFILDDTQNEFDPNSPNFGEKYAPPFVPVTIRDWSGRIVNKTLSDQYGTYNFLGPSTITTNLPAPSGMSPNMLTTCMNDPGDDPNSPDPNWNQQYSTFCYNFQYMPGVTTYLDTPVVPVAAFTGPDQFPLDCEFPDGTPRVWEVRGDGIGPYVANAPGTITITSLGTGLVPNPNYCNVAAGECPDGSGLQPKQITRDYGFGSTAGEIYVGDQLIPAANVTWGANTITANLPAGTTTGQLRVIRGDNGAESVTAVTVQVGLRQNARVRYVTPSGGPLAHDIQNAIDGARNNDLILVGCGTANEMVVMWKPVQLQGSGECTTINAVKAPTDKLVEWRDLVEEIIASGPYLLPGQEQGPGAPEPTTLWNEEGAGILVLGSTSNNPSFERARNRGARIDGFVIRGADTGGGIIVNGNAAYLQISNNRLSNNSGFYGGGIRVGHPNLTNEQPDGGFDYTDARNDYVSVHHNQVVFNGGQGGVGGGISMCTGADSYQITENWVCGNFSLGEGGGIGHFGRSDGFWELGAGNGNNRPWVLTDQPLIADNTVIFNESFFQGSTISGGGIYIGGAAALPVAPGGLTPGAGNVQVIGNLIQGNSAGAGDGGGIRLAGVNGQDVSANPTNTPKRNGNRGSNDPDPWYAVDIYNNQIVNNVAALAGGGISLIDAVNVRLVHNTIANNDSMATAGEAFAPNSPNQSTPQDGAGIVSRAHSAELAVAGNVGTFSDPSEFADNIIWQNRQFFFYVDDESGCTPGQTGCVSTYGVCPDVSGALNCPAGGGTGFDLAVLGTAGTLGCSPASSCILTGDPDPQFVAEYVNDGRSSAFQPEVVTGIQTPAAFDEGGNFIRLKYGPLTLFSDDAPNDGAPGLLFGDYHVQGISPAVNAGDDLTATYPELLFDFDLEDRPSGAGVDIGADEVQQ